MKLNMSFPEKGLQKTVEVDDDRKLLPFFDKRIAAEVPGDSLGDEFKGYVFKISGGNDKQGFPMMQGVLSNTRVRLLFKDGMKCFRERRRGSFKRKSVRGCIVGPDIGVLALSVVKQGDADIPGLTDGVKERRLGPKRARQLMKLYGSDIDKNGNKLPQAQANLPKHVIRRTIEGKKRGKAVKIQRFVTQDRIHRKVKRQHDKLKQAQLSKQNILEYKKMVEDFHSGKKDAHQQLNNAGASTTKKPKPTPSAPTTAKEKQKAAAVKTQPKAAQPKSQKKK